MVVVNCYTTYLLIKARNKFKQHEVTTLSDMSQLCFGERAKYGTDILVITT
jgi:hypothetical protein